LTVEILKKGHSAAMIQVSLSDGSGVLQRCPAFKSIYIPVRNVDIWLPADNPNHPGRRLPVIYMQDGQNLFDPDLSFGPTDWGVDKAITRLVAEKGLTPAIVVGVWNSETRWRDYMPQKVLEGDRDGLVRARYREKADGAPLADNYLKFLVHELKPFIDNSFPTFPDPAHTFIMGSSMGGLLSLYATSEYPEIFGAAACLSTHWLAGENLLVDAMGQSLPDPATHRLYFDYGTLGLDAGYEPFQKRMDGHLRARGYREGDNWVTLKFEGHDHYETFWRSRVDIPLEFLLIT